MRTVLTRATGVAAPHCQCSTGAHAQDDQGKVQSSTAYGQGAVCCTAEIMGTENVDKKNN